MIARRGMKLEGTNACHHPCWEPFIGICEMVSTACWMVVETVTWSYLLQLWISELGETCPAAHFPVILAFPHQLAHHLYKRIKAHALCFPRFMIFKTNSRLFALKPSSLPLFPCLRNWHICHSADKQETEEPRPLTSLRLIEVTALNPISENKRGVAIVMSTMRTKWMMQLNEDIGYSCS